MFHYCEPQKPPQVPLITIQMLSFDQNATFVYQILKLGFSTKIGITFIVMFERRYQYILNRKATLSQNSSHTWNISLSGKCCWYTSKVFTDFQSGWMTSSGAMARIYRPHLKCYFIAEILKANLWKVNELKENNQWRGFFWQIDVRYSLLHQYFAVHPREMVWLLFEKTTKTQFSLFRIWLYNEHPVKLRTNIPVSSKF